MTTLVIDPTTMTKALTHLTTLAGTGQRWIPEGSTPNGTLQDRFLSWYYQNWQNVESLSGLKVEGSHDADALNKFLVDNGFAPMFRQIPKGGVGACAILKMAVKWAVEASQTTIEANGASTGYDWADYKAFSLPISGAEVFSVVGRSPNLVKLNTKDGGGVWLLMMDRPKHDLDLMDAAVLAMASREVTDTAYITSIVAPTVKLKSSKQLDWMLGVTSGDHVIEQAFQLIELGMDETGAFVEAAAGFGTTRSVSRRPEPLVFDQPFACWFTQPGSEIPIAPLYADVSTWTRVEDVL